MTSNKKVEILQNLDFNDLPFIGKSIATLARFSNEKLPVSNGFVVTTLGYQFLLDNSDIRKYFENSKKTSGSAHSESLKSAFDIIEIPEILKEEIAKAYSKISGFTDSYVNLRALILDRDGNELEHRSFVTLDLRGEEKIQKGLVELYSNIIFDNTAVFEKYFSGELQIVVLVQKALQSEASGVMFTTDFITQDKNKLVIEAVYGLESIIELESIVPDQYIYDKSQNKILEKHITTQEFMAVRQPGRTSDVIQKVNISVVWQKRQKLDDKHIFTLAKTGIIIEEGLEEPQEILWSFESGKIWINFIESSKKLNLSKSANADLQTLIDETVVNPEIIVDSGKKDGVDLNVHIPESLSSDKDILMDLVLTDSKDEVQDITETITAEEESSSINIAPVQISHADISSNNFADEVAETEKVELNQEKIIENKEKMEDKTIDQNTSEPLLEGKYFAGGETEGEVCFDAEACKENSILVLKGDENLPSNISVRGFIIEDESEILAERLHEYFEIPTITGVPLARKILKLGEKIKINGQNGHIFETVPFSEQVGEIEMNFSTTLNSHKEDEAHLTVPVNKNEETRIHAEIHPHEKPVLESEDENHIENIEIDEITELNIVDDKNAKETEFKEAFEVKDEEELVSAKPEEEAQITISIEEKSEINRNEDISKLLDLVEEDSHIVEVLDEVEEEKSVEGVNEDEQFNIWGKSLEKIISASDTVSATTAAEAIEQVIDDTLEITENSKEIVFDQEEEYIAKGIQKSEQNKKFDFPHIATATKVYVHLIDENLPSEFKNYDGIIFSSSFDQELYLEILKDVLEAASDKEVIAICPPYEAAALERFLNAIHELRSEGYRKLSLILPDYRNKKEITEVKKLLSISGLKRSSTFAVYANVSRAINVFRLAELEKSLVDGIFFDLFRLKMNMLGVEKQTASTKYVEGMRNLVSYINENATEIDRSIVDITGFEELDKILNHILGFKYSVISCSLPQANEVKKIVSSIEKKHIINSSNRPKSRLRRKI